MIYVAKHKICGLVGHDGDPHKSRIETLRYTYHKPQSTSKSAMICSIGLVFWGSIEQAKEDIMAKGWNVNEFEFIDGKNYS